MNLGNIINFLKIFSRFLKIFLIVKLTNRRIHAPNIHFLHTEQNVSITMRNDI